MKKSGKLAALAVAFIGCSTVGLVVYARAREARVWLSTSSPNNTYTVEMTGDPGHGGLVFDSTVRFNVFRDGQTIADGAHAHSADLLDESFARAYPHNSWIRENVLRFGQDTGQSVFVPDALTISNETDTAIDYVKIKAVDMFLVFDVQPHSNFTLPVPYRSGLGWVACEGRFSDGRLIPRDGVNFPLDTVKRPVRYCVSVTATGVGIAGSHFEGFTSTGWSDYVTIPAAPNCASPK